MGSLAGQRPAIFYAPHQDDEAIGMAGAIQQCKDLGRPVYLVLLTSGANRSLLDILNGSTRCSWHGTRHNFQLTMEQMCWARKMEFVASARQLNVDKVFLVNHGRGLDDGNPWPSYRKFVDRVERTIKRFERKFPRASHNLVSGRLDLLPRGGTNSTHRACWDAAMNLCSEISDFRFYRIYVYWKDRADRDSQCQHDLRPEWRASKRAALDEYKLFWPEAGRFAIGYHSVPQLMDAAAADTKEYLDLLPRSRPKVWEKIRQYTFGR